MYCPKCNFKSGVKDSRICESGNYVYRRRKCLACKYIWTTHEREAIGINELVTFKKKTNKKKKRILRDIEELLFSI